MKKFKFLLISREPNGNLLELSKLLPSSASLVDGELNLDYVIESQLAEDAINKLVNFCKQLSIHIDFMVDDTFYIDSKDYSFSDNTILSQQLEGEGLL